MSSKPSLALVRNIGIMAHIDAGKTTVSERILYYAGRTHRIAEVHDGQATMDFIDQERERGITISSAVTELSWNGHEIFLIDTPGHVDFTVEVERSLRVLDGVVALYDAVSGVEAQSETVWYQSERHKVARLCFINKMDRPGADFERCVKEIRERLGGHPLVVQLPIFEASSFVGVVDVIEAKAYYFDENALGARVQEAELPSCMRAELEAAYETLVEGLADVDDEIAEAYLEGRSLSGEALRQALRRATIALKAQVVLCGSGLKNKGIQPLMDAIVAYLPAPNDIPFVEGQDLKGEVQQLARDEKAPFSALVFKLQQIEGKKLAFCRIYTGKIRVGDVIYLSAQGTSFKCKHLYQLHANRLERLEEASAGSLLAMPRVREMMTGDTLCSPEAPILLERIQAKAPVIAISIETESLKDRDAISEALKVIHEEDPTLIFEEDQETGELLLRGMGELHLEVVVERLRREFNLSVRTGQPSVVQRETLVAAGEESALFERMREQELLYGAVTVSLEPLPRGSGLRAELALTEQQGYLKPEQAQAILEAARDALLYGPRGLESEDIALKVLSIGLDPKGALNLIGSRIAAAEAVRNAYKRLGSKVLEPLMAVDIVAAEENIGDLLSDLTQRNGLVESLDTEALRSVIHAVVPLRNMFGYTIKLRTITHGRGAFSMRFLRYDSLS